MLKKENFVKNLSPMVNDTHKALVQSFARASKHPDPRLNGMIDPFDDLYRIVYMLTVRMVGPTEFVERPELLDQTLHYFEKFESSMSTARVVVPWLPTYSYAKQLFYGAKLYGVMSGVVKERNRTGHRVNDALQFLMDTGEDLIKILTCMFSDMSPSSSYPVHYENRKTYRGRTVSVLVVTPADWLIEIKLSWVVSSRGSSTAG